MSSDATLLLRDAGSLAVLVFILVAITKDYVKKLVLGAGVKDTTLLDVLVRGYTYVVAEAIALGVAVFAHVLTQGSTPAVLGVGFSAATIALAAYHVNSVKQLSLPEIIDLLTKHGLIGSNLGVSGLAANPVVEQPNVNQPLSQLPSADGLTPSGQTTNAPVPATPAQDTTVSLFKKIADTLPGK